MTTIATKPELSQELKDSFCQLACRLSPENLACDGEIPQSMVRARFKQIMAEWKALEVRAGRPVLEEELYP